MIAVHRDQLEAFLQQAGLNFTDTPVIGLGLRGALDKDGVNRVGGFDDLLVVMTADICEAYTGNTDPSTEIANRANLVPGVSWFKMGFHHPGTPQQYPAFVQDGAITVFRYGTEGVAAGTKDDRGLCLGNGLWKGDFAIHIHNAMGVNTTGSEGCQTVIKTEWPPYYSSMSHQLALANRARFPQLLVNATPSVLA